MISLLKERNIVYTPSLAHDQLQVNLLKVLYFNKTITLQRALQQLECREGRFYELLRRYRESPEDFTIAALENDPSERVRRGIWDPVSNQLHDC